MPVEIDMGTGRSVKVDIAGFAQMTPEQQSSAVQQVFTHLSSSGQGGASADNAAPADQAPPDTSYASAFRYGAHNAMEGLGRSLETVGNDIGSDRIANAGRWAENAVSAPTNYQPAGSNMVSDLRAGKWGDALSNLPRAAAEGSADLAGTLGAGGLAALAAPEAAIAGAVGGGGYLVARNFGDNAQARAMNNSRSTPSATDQLVGLGTSAAEAAPQLIGLGFAPKAIEAMFPQAIQTVARPAIGAATEGLGGAASNSIGQLGNSLGTAQGVQFDPSEAAAAGIQAGAAKGFNDAAGVARAGVRAGADDVMSRLVDQPQSADEAASIARVGQMYDQATQNATGNPKPTAVLNSVKSNLVANLTGYVRELNKAGQIEDGEASDIKRLVTRQAEVQNNTIGNGSDPASLFGQLQSLGLPQEALQPLINGVRDLNTVSSQSFLKNQTGPFQQIGNLAGNVGSLGYGVYSGNPMEMFGAIMGHGKAGRIGSVVGSGLDNLLGTSTPPIVLQRMAANRYLQRNGVDDIGPNTLQSLQNARSGLQDAQATFQANQGAADDQAELQRQAIASAQAKAKQMDIIQRQGQADVAQQQANLDASASANDQAQVVQKAAANRQIDAYLSGKTDDGSAPSSVGQTTAQEIQGWQNILQNARNRAKVNAQQSSLLDRAAGSDVDSLAQAAIDKASRSNAIKLAMAGKLPSDRPDVDPNASAASVAQAMASANRIMQQAQSAGDVADRLTVGNPATDPVPVNVPLNANNQPIGQPSASPAQRQTPPAQPQAAPPPPAGAPQMPVAGPQGYGKYVSNYLMANHGFNAGDSHIDSGLDQLTAIGRITPQQAQAIRSNPAMPLDRDLADALKHAIGSANIEGYQGGASGQSYGQSQGFGADSQGVPIGNPMAYRMKTEMYHQQAANLAVAAETAGLPSVADGIREIANEPQAARKAAMRAALLASLPSQGMRQVAARFLPDFLVMHGAAQ